MLGDAVAAGKQLGTAHREKLLGTQTHDIEARPVAITMAGQRDRRLRAQIEVVQRRRYAQVNARMHFSEATEPIAEPLAAKSGDVLTVRAPERWR